MLTVQENCNIVDIIVVQPGLLSLVGRGSGNVLSLSLSLSSGQAIVSPSLAPDLSLSLSDISLQYVDKPQLHSQSYIRFSLSGHHTVTYPPVTYPLFFESTQLSSSPTIYILGLTFTNNTDKKAIDIWHAVNFF